MEEEIYILSEDRARFYIESKSRCRIQYLSESEFLYGVYLPAADFVKLFVIVHQVHSCELGKVVEYCRQKTMVESMVIEDTYATGKYWKDFLVRFFKNEDLGSLYRAALFLKVKSLMDDIADSEEYHRREEKKKKKKEEKKRNKPKLLLHFGSSC